MHRLPQILIVVILLVLGFYVGQPYLDRMLFSASTPRAVTPRGSLADIERTTIELFERVSPSVVQVVARAGGPEAMQSEPDDAQSQSGTGFIWDAAGHIVTNDHVVHGTEQVAVRLSTGRVLKARIVGTAPNYDLAVLRVDDTRALPAPVAIGSSDDLKVGQWVFAIGNPFGLDQSLTTGIISALKRHLPTEGGREIANVIQTDAAINPGNSGGPLLDSAGRVIGVTTAILSPSGTSAGIGFAIPIDTVNRVVPEIIARRICADARHRHRHRRRRHGNTRRRRRRGRHADGSRLAGRPRGAARDRPEQPQARRRDRRRERQDGPQAARPDRGTGARRRRQEGRATGQTRRPGGHDGCRGDGYRQAPLRQVAATADQFFISPAAFKALVMTAPTSTGKTGGVGISSGAG